MTTPTDIRSAQFNDTYFPIVDGVVNAVHNYASIMNRYSYACVVTPKPLSKDYNDSTLGYEVFRTRSARIPLAEYSIPTPKFDPNVKEFLSSRNLDIFHVHSPFFEGTFASAYAKKLGIPCVATFHSKYYDDTVNITGSKTLAKIVTKRIVRFYHGVDSVWSVSQGAADTLRSYGYSGDIFVIDNGTSYDIPKNPEELRARAAAAFSIPQDKHILLFVGHQIWHKNLKLILDTFKMLNDRSKDYLLLIVGDGYDEVAIREYADSLHFSEGSVRFLGRVDDRDLLAGIYLNADLFFFPSVYDTSGLVIREAAAMGVPSLLTDGSNAAEAVKKDVSGFVALENKVAMYREIVRLFTTPGLLERVGKGAQRDIPKTWEVMVPKAMEKYAEVIEKYRYEHR